MGCSEGRRETGLGQDCLCAARMLVPSSNSVNLCMSLMTTTFSTLSQVTDTQSAHMPGTRTSSATQPSNSRTRSTFAGFWPRHQSPQQVAALQPLGVFDNLDPLGHKPLRQIVHHVGPASMRSQQVRHNLCTRSHLVVLRPLPLSRYEQICTRPQNDKKMVSPPPNAISIIPARLLASRNSRRLNIG